MKPFYHGIRQGDMLVFTIIGFIAATLTTLGFVPQIIKMWRTKSAEDVSVGTLYQFSVGVSLWAVYGFSRKDPVVIIANIVGLVLLVMAIGLYYWLRLKHPAE